MLDIFMRLYTNSQAPQLKKGEELKEDDDEAERLKEYLGGS